MNTCDSRLDFSASPEIRQVIAGLGRTEDIRLSPDCKQLAVACFARNQVVIFDVDFRSEVAGKQIHLTSAKVLSSPDLHKPHGLDFFDEQTLIVANRGGTICQFKLPASEEGSVAELTLASTSSLDPALVDTPGSVAVNNRGMHCELLICNNYAHTVGRLQLDGSGGLHSPEVEIFLSKWLDIPDGVSIGRSGNWLAVSNHGLHTGMLYHRSTAHPDADPQALLLGAHYPHGVRITSNDRIILMADAGTPFIHVYSRPDARWQGLHYPCLSLRVMDAARFLRGRYSPLEGGPKGLDLHPQYGIMVTTCESQPLAFFDIQSLLDTFATATSNPSNAIDDPYFNHESAQDVHFELERLQRQADADRAKPQLQAILRSNTWRMTAPFRHLGSLLKRSFTATFNPRSGRS